MKRKALVAVVTINWFGGPDTVACLESLVAQDHPDWMVVVVDNGSTDGSPEVVQAAMQRLAAETDQTWQRLGAQAAIPIDKAAMPPASRFTLIDSGRNRGFAAGNNLGIKFAIAAGADYIWILNNDVEVHPAALTALLWRLAQGDGSVAGSVLVYHSDPGCIQCIGGASFNLWLARGHQIGEGTRWDGVCKLGEPTDIAYIAGASMLLSATTLQSAGFMEERYFLYFEEIDWMMRLKRLGPPVVATDSIVLHKEGASIGTASRSVRSLKSQYYLSRNLVLFYRWNHPRLLPVACLRNAREALRLSAAGHQANARMVLRATLDAVLGRHGFREGL